MWTRRRLLAATLPGIALPAAAFAQPAAKPAAAAAPLQARFIGVWRLVSFTNIDEQGRTTPNRLSEGRIMYDAAGNMAAQLMRPGRPVHAAAPPTDAERAASYGSYVAYYGRYSIDEATAKVTHHVEGALNPNWPKTDLVRYWAFSPDGKRLSLSVRNAAGRTTGTLVWEKIQ
jgi:hypothetical protein